MATPITAPATPSEAPSQLYRDRAQSKDPRISPLPLPVLTRGSRRTLLFLTLLAIPQARAQTAEPPTVRIAVLTLFHPHTLILSTPSTATLHLDNATLLLPPNQPLTLRSSPAGVIAELPGAPALDTHTIILPPSTFTLTVPGKLTRTYIGALTLTTRNDTLLPILIIDTELAVASILAAESPPHASPEALKAQAIVSRSYLLAHPSAHIGFDACDTTHCQFLRSPPATRQPLHRRHPSHPQPGLNLPLLPRRPTPHRPRHVLPKLRRPHPPPPHHPRRLPLLRSPLRLLPAPP